jgi:hypothetical protein
MPRRVFFKSQVSGLKFSGFIPHPFFFSPRFSGVFAAEPG